MDISSKIKAIREAKKIKQIDIANALDLDPSYYFRLEKRGDKMTIEQLGKIAGALDITTVELLTDEPKEDDNSLHKRINELEEENKQLNEWLYNAGEQQIRVQILVEEGFRFFLQQCEADLNLDGNPFTEFYLVEPFHRVGFADYPFFREFIEKYRTPLIAFISTCGVGVEYEALTDLFFESMKPYSATEEKLLSEYEMQKKVRERRRSLKGVDNVK